MEHAFHTLQEFLTHSKGVTYVIMGLVLIGFVGFWRFLGTYDEEKKKTII